ncbi:MAG TPA: DUF2079 domain-containing protein [Ktedonobacteraceae bacterium]|nr:DUF2079 domain-containing protein [Ktedonobacteraceae bacterium]
MINATWRKRFSILANRLYLYPSPDPMPHTRLFWFAMGLVTLAVAAFSGYFILYTIAQHNAFVTNAEDFGIYDQALWSTVHGQVLHQTICNILSDTNCVTPNGIMRFAIHFEPILFPLSLFYLLWPDPKILLVLQTLVVASGAYPAFWLARLRLRSELAGVAIALLYLLYPAQQQAVVFDFHAVTFTAALLLFTLYFMYTRQTLWLFVFAILSMACKEEIPAVVIMFGLWSMLFQRRWRSGLALALLGTAWLVLGLYVIIPHFSPTGRPLLVSRFGHLGGPGQLLLHALLHPVDFLKQYVFEGSHFAYLHSLFSPAGFIALPAPLRPLYLVLFAPWVLVLALPSIAANLLSSEPGMYTGIFHYNAEIVPVLIFATIEAIVLILWLVYIIPIWWRRGTLLFFARKGVRSPQSTPTAPAASEDMASTNAAARPHLFNLPAFLRAPLPQRLVPACLLTVLLTFVLFNAVKADYSFYGHLPFSSGFQWPSTSAHTALAQRFIGMIPPTASVSAQNKLVPHLSHREKIYLFPYASESADYIFLDINGDIYPYPNVSQYMSDVQKVMASGNYGVLAAQDGYVLLKRGLPPSRGLPGFQRT